MCVCVHMQLVCMETAFVCVCVCVCVCVYIRVLWICINYSYNSACTASMLKVLHTNIFSLVAGNTCLEASVLLISKRN